MISENVCVIVKMGTTSIYVNKASRPDLGKINSFSNKFLLNKYVQSLRASVLTILLTRLLGPYQEIRRPIFFVRPELARGVRKSEGFVFLVRTE